jgi:hypothetical protein
MVELLFQTLPKFWVIFLVRSYIGGFSSVLDFSSMTLSSFVKASTAFLFEKNWQISAISVGENSLKSQLIGFS